MLLQLAIQGFDYIDSLLIVDNIVFESDLGFECGEDLCSLRFSMAE